MDSKDHKHSSSELLSSAKLVADAAKSSFNKESDKVDKGKVAGAGANLLDGAQEYGKLDENKGVGQYVEKAETYLHQYSTSHDQSTPTTKPAESHETGAGGKDSGSGGGGGGGVGDYMKMAQGFFGK